MNMTFNELLVLVSSGEVSGICIDSRLVKSGDIFIAVRGSAYDGHDFIDQAVNSGAKYVVCQQPHQSKDVHTIIVKDPAQAAALLAQASRGEPASKLVNLAVTGTNGKTTVAFLVHCCLQKNRKKCGLISTIFYDTGLSCCDATLTTPDCLIIAEKQEQMVEAGFKYMVAEASSHALSQNRLAGVNFHAAAFTNLTGDHLDYHKTEKDYLAAKSILFKNLSPNATAVLNKQSPQAASIAKETKAQILWYAVDEDADITAKIQSADIDGTTFVLEYASQKQVVKTPLLGRYNISNHLAAAGLCLAAGLDLKAVAAGLCSLKVVGGRLEKVDWDGNFSVIVDYAHTDDALKNVLTTLRPLCKGRLIVVFGCGGDRDTSKRPRMAKVAEQLADIIFVTSDNPRTEEPEYIIGEIVTGFENPVAETITTEVERKKAIELAVKIAKKDDIVLLAGKGHETYQLVGKQKIDFSDKQIATDYLKGLK